MEMFENIEAWRMERCGKFTASEIHKLMVKGKSGEYFGQTALSYIRMKAAEILTLEIVNGGRLNTAAMEWGNAHEFEAVERFESLSGLDVEYMGGGNPKFFEWTPFSGGSPDGIVKGKGIIEVKCPYNSGEHIEHFLLDSPVSLKAYAPEYYWQMQMNMMVTSLPMGYFISYDCRFAEEHLQVKVLEIPADAEAQALLKERIAEAEKQLSVLIGLVRGVD